MKILTSPSSFGKISKKPFDILTNNGFEFINNPYGRKLTTNETIELAIGCVGIIAGVETYDRSVLDRLPFLKCISRVGVGMDSIDMNYAKTRSINVVNTPYGPTQSVAEFTLALTFSLLKNIPNADHDMKNNVWRKVNGNLIFGKKIGIIGLGKIGKLTAKMFTSLGLDVYAYDLYPDKEWMIENNIKILTFKELLKNSDIVCIHIPGNSNNSIITRNELSIMKENSILINVSRGGVVDENDLYEFLKYNKIKGAAIDVFSEEPYKGKFSELNNVILTPHIGSYSVEGKVQMEIDATKNLINYFKSNK